MELLQKHESLFDGTLGKWKGPPYHIDLQPGAKPYRAKPYSIPEAYKQTLKLELDR